MTVTSTGVAKTASGNGATTVFPYDFEIPTAADASVYVTNLTTGTRTDLLPTQYGITGLGTPAGGNVTYPLAGNPLPAGYQITTERIVALLQPNVIPDQGNFYSSTVEDIVDRLTMMMQQVAAKYDRTLRAPMSDAALNYIPNASLRANTTLGFDAAGQPIAGAVTGTIVSAAMLAIVQAASTAAAITALFAGSTKLGGVGFLTGSAAWDPGNVADNASVTTNVPVIGAAIGDFVPMVSFGLSLQGMQISGEVSAADTVRINIQNDTGGAIDLANSTVRAVVVPRANVGL